MNIEEIEHLTSAWQSGTFEIHEEDNILLGLYEGRGAYNSRNSMFIDSPLSDRRREQLEDELNDLISGTCFRRSEEDDLETDDSFVLGFEANLDDPNLKADIIKLVNKE